MELESSPQVSPDAKSYGTMELKIDYFNHLPVNKLSIISEPCQIQNLSWHVLVKKKSRYRDEPQSVGIHVQCNRDDENTSWSCCAKVTITLVSQKPGVADYSREFQHEFNPEEDFWGFDRFMPWNEVIDPERGYIVDNAITIRAHIVVDIPKVDKAVKRKLMSSSKEVQADASAKASPAKRAKSITTEPDIIDDILQASVKRAKCKSLPSSKPKEIGGKKMKSLESELSQLKQDLADEKSTSEKMSEELKTKSAKLDTFYSTITTLESRIVSSNAEKFCQDVKSTVANLESKTADVEVLKSEFEKVDLKLQQFMNVQLEKEKERDESLKSIIAGLETKVANVEGRFESKVADVDGLKSKLEKMDLKLQELMNVHLKKEKEREESLKTILKMELKLKEFSEQFDKEKERSDAYKDLLRKVLE